MLIEIHRCKHCGRQYNYQASGYGCHDEENNAEYCPDCMRAILKVLSAIPAKYEKRFQEIPFDEKLVEKLEDFKAVDNEEQRLFPKCMVGTPEMAAMDYDHIDLYNCDFDEYAVAYDDPGEKHLFMMREYDLENGRFTGGSWRDGKAGMSHASGFNILKRPAKASDMISSSGRGMGEPSGKLFYNEMEV